jgi:hypothetical protein
MITHSQKEKLLANWGEKAEAMACRAEVKLHDPLSGYECYIYAMNPEDEDEVFCIINGIDLEISLWRISDLATRFNSEGEGLCQDKEYRPRMAAELFKTLLDEKRYGKPRN